MNITIVGTGAVGSVVAVALARADADVTALLRPDAVAESGSSHMQVTGSAGEPQWAIVPSVADLTEQPDVVILCVPAHELAQASMTLAHLPAHIPVLALHAAPEADAGAQQALGRRIIGGTFTGQAEYMGPGQARAVNAGLALDPAINEHPAVLASLRSALPVTLAAIAPLRWARLLVDLPQAIGAVVDQPFSALATERQVAALTLQLLTEATRTLATAGLTPSDLPDVDMGRLRKLHTVPGLFANGALKRESAVFPGERALPASLWQRLRRRRTTEVDALHGAIVRLGAEVGVPTPIHARLVEAMHAVTSRGTFLSLDEMKRALSRG
jgi:2-dehydropantoate 2-reductase